MLEGPSFIVSRDVPNACEQESSWMYNAFAMIQNTKRKRSLEDEECVRGMDQEDNQQQGEDFSETSSLISQIGLDLSINCLLHCSRSDYGSIASLNKSFRSLIRSGYLYKLRRQLSIVEHWVYFSCNLPEWEAFDPLQCRWMRLPTMPLNECFMCSDKESLAVGTELLVFGKEIQSHMIYKYSILTNSWTTGMMTKTPRCLFGSASLGEIAIVAGGCDSKGKILSSAELYNSKEGIWYTLPSMNKPRKLCSGVFVDGKFYVIGGVGVGNSSVNSGVAPAGTSNLIVLTCGEVYDLKSRTWVEIPNMFPEHIRGERTNDFPTTTKAPPLLAVVKNELYAAYYDKKEVWKYDKLKNVWTMMGRLPEQVASVNGWGLAFRACGNQLIVIGGPRGTNGGFIEINAWEPNEGTPQWTLLGRKHLGSFVYNCAVMGC